MSITILDLAKHRAGREVCSGQDFADVGLQIMGGCELCGASIAAYNACPSKSGNWRCEDCIGDSGFETVEEANEAIFALSSPKPQRFDVDETISHLRYFNENQWSAAQKLAEHILAMADDAYLVGHPEWAEIVKDAKAVLS